MTKKSHILPYDGSKLDTPPSYCVADGCSRPIMARGMCSMHYSRFQKYGSMEPIKPSNKYSAIYYHWMKTKKRFPNDISWKNFSDFFKDTGEKPSYLHMIFKKDESIPLGKNNFEWKVRPANKRNYAEKKFDYTTAEGKSAYDKNLRTKKPNLQKHYNLMKSYGITIEEFNKKLVEQKGCCAICENPETVTKHGRPMSLSVDHNHSTGEIRGLLCTSCNRALGLFKEKRETLLKAISYISLYAKNDSNVLKIKEI